MKIRIFQKGFNYSQDGQGNRLVYHLQGCNMRCPWCANPEGMHFQGAKGFSWEDSTIEEIVEEVRRSSLMFFDGGGGTFTGGEATCQFEALKELLKRLKAEGIHTAMETNGTHPELPKLFPHIDQLMMDCKHWEEGRHREYTGVSLEPVKRNLKAAMLERGQVDVRIPLIGGVNDSPRDQQGFADLFLELSEGKKLEQVTFEILKYHEFGRQKWETCGLPYAMTEKAHVTIEQIKTFRELLKARSLTVKKT